MIDFCVDSASLATSFKKCNVFMTCREIDNVYQATCNAAVNMNSNWKIKIYIRFYMNAHVLLNLLNKLRKRDMNVKLYLSHDFAIFYATL